MFIADRYTTWVNASRPRTVDGPNAKNRQTRHVPLNEEAVSVLRRWREQSPLGARIFNMATGFRTAWGKLPAPGLCPGKTAIGPWP
jgi:integrase